MRYLYRYSIGMAKLMMILLIFWWKAKTVAGSYMRVTMGEWLVWGQISDPNVNQDTIGKL
jgi:hypothetical protein